MTESPTGDMRRSFDPSLRPDSENRDSRCVGKNETHYTKDILGDLGASPVNSVTPASNDPASMDATLESFEALPPESGSSNNSGGGGDTADADAGADLISAVPGSVDGMNEYLMQHMRSLLNPLLVGGGSRAANAVTERGMGAASSGGSSSDDENDVLVWRLPPTPGEARMLHEVVPAPHDVSGDFIDIDMVTPSNHSMDGTSSMDEEPFGVIQNNLDGSGCGDEEENDEEEVGEASAELDPFLRRVEGSPDAEPSEAEAFNNLSLNLTQRESRMNVTSSEEFPSPPPPNVSSAPGESQCECAAFLWCETLNCPPMSGDDKVMLWSAEEVEEKRYFGLGDSSLSGPTALANVLSVFNLQHRVSIRALRNATPCTAGAAATVEEGVPLSQFLLSRCAAGCPAAALVSAVSRLTEGSVRGFFLPLRAAVVATSGPGGAAPLCGRWSCLWRWLAGLLRAGVVPMVTLNCQQQGLAPIDWIVPPDWHHQMVYGIDAGGLYLTGPEEFLPGDMAMTQLVSENILLVRKSQILALWKKDSDLWDLAMQPDPKWETMNVLGQVVGTLRQSGHKNFRGFQPEWAHHVAVPTPTHAGLTLFVRAEPNCETSQHLCQRLQHLSDLLHARLLSL